MTNAFGIILIIFVALLAMTFFRDGTDTIKEEPFQSTVESGKIVFETGKGVVSWGAQQYNSINQDTETSNPETNLIEIGQIPCATDEDCNEFLSQCDDNCQCIDLTCWKEG